MESGCEITVEFEGKTTVYSDANCNWYQKILMLKIKEEKEYFAHMQKQKRSNEDLMKQIGVIEWFVKQLPVYDSIKFCNHMFGKGVPLAAMVKHEQRRMS
jgi:hypothetical protein